MAVLLERGRGRRPRLAKRALAPYEPDESPATVPPKLAQAIAETT
jgi:hypothetical protein